MDRITKANAIGALARSAAEIAADVAQQTSEAAATGPESAGTTAGRHAYCNLTVGTLIPAREGVERLRQILETIEILHRTPEARDDFEEDQVLRNPAGERILTPRESTPCTARPTP